jgi:hypothetical protein
VDLNALARRIKSRLGEAEEAVDGEFRALEQEST